MLVKYRSFDKSSSMAGLMSSAYSQLFHISNQSGWQVSGVSCASHSSMNHSCCLAHSCLGASGSGRYGVGQMERPHGSSRCFAFVYAQLIKNNKRCHPRVSAIWETPDNSFSCSPAELLDGSFEKELFSGAPLTLHSATMKTGAASLPVLLFSGTRRLNSAETSAKGDVLQSATCPTGQCNTA